MPGIGRPSARIATGSGVKPQILGTLGSSSIGGVIPCAGPAIALKTEDHCLPVRHHLVQIDLDVGNIAHGAGGINPSVVEEIGGGGVRSKQSRVSFPAEICVGGEKFACRAA